MVGRDESSGTSVDPDDWFSNTGSRSIEEPTWLEDGVAADQSIADSPFSRRRLVASAVAVLVLVVGVVVARVAFGSGGSSAPPEATPTPGSTTTAPTTTAPATPAPSAPAVTLPADVLKPGASGAEVKTLQRALARAGHSPGPVDGDYGPRTEQAVSDSQRSAGLAVDGIYGPQTKKALQQELNAG